MSYVIERIAGCIHWRFEGELSTAQVIEAYGELYGHESFDETRAQVRNFRAVRGEPVSVAEVKQIAAFDRAAALSNPHMKVALVTPDDMQHQILAALYSVELFDSPWEVAIFDCEEQALAWAM